MHGMQDDSAQVTNIALAFCLENYGNFKYLAFSNVHYLEKTSMGTCHSCNTRKIPTLGFSSASMMWNLEACVPSCFSKSVPDAFCHLLEKYKV